MKKQYIMPYTQIVCVELQKFIAASNETLSVDEDYIETNSNNVASRRSSIWGDDEE